jgi:WD40 repeat protein
MQPVHVSCPACKKSLKTVKEPAPGTRLKCPKCQAEFRYQAPTAEPAVAAPTQQHAAAPHEASAEPAGAAAADAAASPSGKSSRGPFMVVGLLALVGLILVVGAGGVFVGYRMQLANRGSEADAGGEGGQDPELVKNPGEKDRGAPQDTGRADSLPRIDAGEVFGDSTPAADDPRQKNPSSPNPLPMPDGNGESEDGEGSGQPGGKRVVSTGSADTIQVSDRVQFVDARFSPDGTMLATLDGVGNAVLWDLKTREGIDVSLVQKGGMYDDDGPHVVFSPDGGTLVVGCPGSIAVIDVKEARLRWEAGNRREAGRLLVSPTATTVALFEGDNGNITANTRLSVFDVATGQPLIRDIPWKYTRDVALSPDGKRMAALEDNRDVRIFDLVAGKEAGAAAGIGSAPDMAFLPDSRTLVLPSRLQLWDVSNPDRPKLAYRAADEGLSIARLSPDGRNLYGIMRGQRIFWDIESRKKRADVPGVINNLTSFSGDSRLFAAALEGTTPSVVVVNAASGATITVVEIGKGTNDRARCVALSADGTQLAVGVRYEVLLKSLSAGTPSAPGRELVSLTFAPPDYLRTTFEEDGLMNTEFADDLWFTPDGRRLVVRGGYSTVWNLAEKRQELVLMLNDGRGQKINFAPDLRPNLGFGPGGPFPAPFGGCYLRPGSNILTICTRSSVIDYDLATGAHLMDGNRPQCTLIVPAPNGEAAAAVLKYRGDDKRKDEIVIVDTQTSAIKKSLGIWKARSFDAPHTYQWMTFSPDSRLLAAAVSTDGSRGERLLIWDWQTGNEVPTTADLPFARVEFVDHGKALCTFGEGGKATVYDVESGNRTGEIDLDAGHSVRVRGLAFSPTGPLFASADADGMLLLRDLSGGAVRARWNAHEAAILAVAFSHDGKQLATAGEDRTVKLWDVSGEIARGE